MLFLSIVFCCIYLSGSRGIFFTAGPSATPSMTSLSKEELIRLCSKQAQELVVTDPQSVSTTGQASSTSTTSTASCPMCSTESTATSGANNLPRDSSSSSLSNREVECKYLELMTSINKRFKDDKDD